jgi:CHAD domain-containing protein
MMVVRYGSFPVKAKSSPNGVQRTTKLFQKLAATTRRIAAQPTPERVHDLRTTIRRIETLLAAQEADDVRGTKKLLKQLTRLRRRAGKVRDIDVQLEALRSVTLDGSRREIATLNRHLEKVHAKRERKLVAAVEDELSTGLTSRLKRAMATAGSGKDAVSPKDFTRTALRRFQGLVRRYSELDETNLHEFRLRCKRVRYLAELDGDSARSQPVITELKRIQDSIGQWHDWVALTEVAEQVIEDSNSPLLSALRTQRRSKFIGALRTTYEAKQRLMGGSPHPSKKAARSEPATGMLPKSSAAGAA